jgi:hypothetical protein
MDDVPVMVMLAMRLNPGSNVPRRGFEEVYLLPMTLSIAGMFG